MTEDERKRIFEEWLGKHKGLLFKVVRAYAFTLMDQEDLFQDIAIQMWRSIPAFRGESAVTTWLYRIALNTAMKWRQKEKKLDERKQSAELLEETQTAKDERLGWLYEEINRLDAVDRSVALLLLEGFSYKEMAGILGITETNVGVKINRIKKRLTERSKTKGLQ